MAQEGKCIMSEKSYLERLAEMHTKNELKMLEGDSEFEFACLQCGKCCHNRMDILISPHDFYHLVRETGKEPMEVIRKYMNVYIGEHSNVTIMQLRYREEEDGSTTCYFLGRKDGKYYCRVQAHKPFVCRAFPLGRMNAYKTDEKEPNINYEPKYFQQPDPNDGCEGLEVAKRNGIMQKVVDWLGGSDMKEKSDRYSQLFNRYSAELFRTINLAELRRLDNQEVANKYYQMMFIGFYLNYDFTADEDSFLAQYEENWEKIIDMSRLLAMHPNGKLVPRIA